MQKVLNMSIETELLAFDKLPTELRQILNYTYEHIDPRYVLGMYKTQGLNRTVNYLDDIGMIPKEDKSWIKNS